VVPLNQGIVIVIWSHACSLSLAATWCTNGLPVLMLHPNTSTVVAVKVPPIEE